MNTQILIGAILGVIFKVVSSILADKLDPNDRLEYWSKSILDYLIFLVLAIVAIFVEAYFT